MALTVAMLKWYVHAIVLWWRIVVNVLKKKCCAYLVRNMTMRDSCSRAYSSRLNLHCGRNCRTSLSFTPLALVVAIRAWSWCKVSHRWKTWLIVPRSLMQMRVCRCRSCISSCGSLTAQWKDLFGSRPWCYGLGLGSWFWQELFEVFQ